MNISLVLEMAADTFPDRIALTNNGVHYSYGQLFVSARQACARFAESGAGYVSYLGESSPEMVIALFGAAMAGKPFSPLNYRLTTGEKQRLLERLASVYLIAGADQASQVPEGLALVKVAVADFLSDIADAGEPIAEPSDDEDSVAVQLFTSGTTGEPKAAVLRHRNLLGYILGSIDFAAAGEDEATLTTVPPYHIAGISAILSSIYATRRIVQLPAFAPESWLAECRSQAVSNAFLVPTMLSRIIEFVDENGVAADLPAMRAIAFGGGKMPLPVIQRALTLWPNINFTNAYGLTETSSTISLLGPDDHREAHGHPDPAIARRLESVGKPLPSLEIEIRDNEGKVLAPNETGEVFVRGAQVSGEYQDRKLTDAAGWFPTRDSGFIDEHGYLFLAGRIDDVIVRGGENISPGEIEQVLHDHPGVRDVAVVGLPSVEWGEAPAAAVVPQPGASIDKASLQQLVRERLRSSRVPERIAFVEALPYNETGKLLRRKVRDLFVG